MDDKDVASLLQAAKEHAEQSDDVSVQDMIQLMTTWMEENNQK
ncbi:hypothetical protein [Alkalicoccus urumqiensis]|nr:hypothetical protein [Alkalicoccus urumqiensis]